MSPPELPPPMRHYSAGQIVMIVIGIILMLPGACALVFMTQMGGEVRWSDPITQMIVVLWAICFAVSALGVALIVWARKRARTAL